MSKILRPTDVSEVPIYCDSVLCGTLKRTPKGSSFTYDAAFLALANKPSRGIAHHLPYTDKPILTAGSRLHTFFEGLLPEGHRLQAIVNKAGTSKDDLFSAFVEAGPDTIGDIYSQIDGSESRPDIHTINLAKLDETDFDEFENRLLQGARDASIPGVQSKLSAALLTQRVAPSKNLGPSILKLSPEKYPKLVENEAFFMKLAADCGLRVPKTKVVADKNGRKGLLVARFDRIFDSKQKAWRRAHQEDACQLADIYPANKYNISYKDVVVHVLEACESKQLALSELCQIYAYSYVIGNADLHGKNISVLRRDWHSQTAVSPVYDLVSTLPYKDLDRRMALKMDAKDDEFKRSDFLKFFGRFGLNENVIHHTLDTICNEVEWSLSRIETIGFDKKVTDHLKREIGERCKRLG